MADYKVKAEGLNEALSTFFAITPPHLRPVDIHEALPQEDDVDEMGRCWWFHTSGYGDPYWALADHTFMASNEYVTHWIAAKHIACPLVD